MYMPKSARPIQEPTIQPNIQQNSGYMPKSAKPVEKTVSGFIGNVGKSSLNLATGLGSALVNTVNPNLEENTIANLGRLAGDTVGAASDFISGKETPSSNKFTQLADTYKQRYGGLENIGNTLYNDPAGVALDASMVLGGAGALAKAGKLGKTANVFSKAAKYTDPLTYAGKATSKVGSMANKFGNNLVKSGENLVTRGLGNPVAQAKLEAKTGIKPSEFIEKHNLYSRSPEMAGEVKNAIGSQYEDLAMNSGKVAQLNKVVASIDNAIKELSTGANKFSDSAKSQVKELMRRKAQVQEMAGGKPEMNISDVTSYRRALDKDIPGSMFNLDAKGSGVALGAKKMRDILKGTIDESDPRLAKLGKEYGMSKGMEDIMSKAAARGSNRQMLNFTKLGSAGLGSVMAGVPGAIAGFATEQIVNSPQFIKAASKTMKGVGKKLSTTPSAKNISRINKIKNVAGKLSKTGFLLNRD